MAHRPVKTKDWIAFLNYHGFTFSGRIKGSHHQYTKKGAIRAIPVWAEKKEIPANHIKISCRTIGVTAKEAYDWIENNC